MTIRADSGMGKTMLMTHFLTCRRCDRPAADERRMAGAELFQASA